MGVVVVLASIFGGQWVSRSESIAPFFRLSAMTLAFCVIAYGFLASALPVWLLLAPRDYLSTFVKLGVVMMLGIGILFVRPELQMPAFTRFTDGTGPIFAGKIFPFCFITIACGAISGFHALISSGTTPKLIAKEWHAWPVGYGSMLLESFVAGMAMIAACVLQPGIFFAVNSPAGIVGTTAASTGTTLTSWGVHDPLGGINALSPRFGVANPLLATIALCVGASILVQMHRARFMWVTCLPLAWLVIVTFTATYEKVFSPLPRIGFLAQASSLEAAIEAGKVPAANLAHTRILIFNARLDAFIFGGFVIIVATILGHSIHAF